MKARLPSHAPAIDALVQYREARQSSLSRAQCATLDEIARRLRRLDAQAARLIELNNRFTETEVPKVDFDPQTDTVAVRVGDVEIPLKLNRADPRKPISMETLTVGGAYTPESSSGGDAADESARLIYEGLLEEYYYNAHRVLKLVKTLPGLRGFDARQITIVRNKLVEHPDEGEAYSFGFGSSGPVVRPMHGPDREWKDEGLVPNAESFISKLTSALVRERDPGVGA
jgi:hypothetical protein